MTAGYRSWPTAARDMALAIDAAVSAARDGNSEAFGDATAALALVDREQLLSVLGTITHDLLERSYPDGLDSDGAEEILQSCFASATGWYEPLDTDSLVGALTGALGISDPDDAPALDRTAVVAHGLLLIADRLTALDLAPAPVIDSALGELMRAQTVELP
jgi:hypothetical protein